MRTARSGLGFSYVIGGNGGVAFKAAQEQVARFVDGQVLPPPPAALAQDQRKFQPHRSRPEPDRARRHRCRGLGSARAQAEAAARRRDGRRTARRSGLWQRRLQHGAAAAKQPPQFAAEQAARGLTAVKPRVKGTPSDAAVIAAVRDAIPSHVQDHGRRQREMRSAPGAVADGAGARSWPAVRRGAAAGACARRLSQALGSRGQRSRPASICRRARASCRSFPSGSPSVIQPDLAMVGGLTPVLELATLAEAFDATVSPHFLPGLFAHVAAAAIACAGSRNFRCWSRCSRAGPRLSATAP